jgi:hypothetical protein
MRAQRHDELTTQKLIEDLAGGMASRLEAISSGTIEHQAAAIRLIYSNGNTVGSWEIK